MELSEDTIIAKLRDYYPNLSSAQQRIADFIVDFPNDAMFLTAAQLGERIGISESSVIRFTQAIGFGGYPEFRRELRARFRERLPNAKGLEIYEKLRTSGSGLVSEIANLDISLIQETALQLDPNVLERCVDRILAADQVFVTGHRNSYAIAEFFAATLQLGIGIGTALAYGHGLAFETLVAAKPNDVVVAVSITPYSQQTLDILTAARSKGLHVIAITDRPLGAPARLADEVIVFETLFHGVTSSYVGAMTIFHSLLAMITNRDPARVERFHREAEAFRAAFHTVGDEDNQRENEGRA